jgi:hypothetical protein
MIKNSVALSLLFVFLYTFPSALSAQPCNVQVSHHTGTQSYGCTEVTITEYGSTTIQPSFNNCGWGFFAGLTASGGFTFTFNPPVPSVDFTIWGMNNWTDPERLEEVAFDINGAFFPVTAANISNLGFCGQLPAIITGTGTLIAPQCPNFCNGSESKITFDGSNISSVTLHDHWLTGEPGGTVFKVFFCCPQSCETDAGVLAGDELSICGNDPAGFSPPTQTFLDANDILRYILFSNPADTLGSIVATSATPTFAFNPVTMQKDVPYYFAAIAGNNLGGMVDLNDPCLYISNAIQVVWHDIPSATFSITNTTVCEGNCAEVQVNFVGSPPFTLTWTTPFTGQVTETFSDNVGTFQVCPPAGGILGSFSLSAVQLTDLYCICD